MTGMWGTYMNRTTRLAAAITAAASVVAFGAASAANTRMHPGSATAAARAARTALRGITANLPATAQQLPGARHSARGLTRVETINWSGYADDNSKGNKYSKASGDWTEPAVTCPTKELQIAVFWVGIDGFNGNTVEQDGTLAQCYEGKAYYYTWWEMYPTNDIQLVGTTVKAGDKIAGSVVKSGTKYTLKLTDSTTHGNNISTTQTCAASVCLDASAEWIAETPSYGRGYTPLPDFKTFTVSSASVTSGSKTGTIKTFPDDQITLEGTGGADVNGYPLAKPGALNSAGTGFTEKWDNSY
jgi:Peptidase A4 family